MGVIFLVGVVYVDDMVCVPVKEGGQEEGGREWKRESHSHHEPVAIRYRID